MDIKLKCTCGKVEGVACDITPSNGNRVVCCCDDCQAFSGFLQRNNDILDEFGGTDIYQTSQSQIKITSGNEHLACVKIKPKGLIRWYARCCNTPVGNTMNASMPFVGVIHNFMKHDGGRDDELGPVRAYVQTAHALGKPTYPHSSRKFPFGITWRIIRKMLVWKIKGLNKPSVFFDANSQPIAKPEILGK